MACAHDCATVFSNTYIEILFNNSLIEKNFSQDNKINVLSGLGFNETQFRELLLETQDLDTVFKHTGFKQPIKIKTFCNELFDCLAELQISFIYCCFYNILQHFCSSEISPAFSIPRFLGLLFVKFISHIFSVLLCLYSYFAQMLFPHIVQNKHFSFPVQNTTSLTKNST